MHLFLHHVLATTGTTIGEPLRGHADAICSLAFLPDGSQFVSSSYDGEIRQWNTTSGDTFGQPLRHEGMVHSVSFFGKHIASCSWDGTRVWDTTLGIAIGKPLGGHDGRNNSVTFSPDGTLIACSNNRKIRLWKAATGELVKELAGHSDEVRPVVFTPDGTQIVSGSDDKTIRLWNVSTGETVGEPLQGHCHTVASVAASPDGTLIASGSYDQTVRMWDLKTSAMIGTPLEGHNAIVNSVAISPDGTKIASGSYDKTIRLWSVKNQAPIGKPIQGHSKVVSVAFSHDGAFIVSGFDDGIIQLWNVETGAKVAEPLSGHTSYVASVACSPDGVHIASGSHDQSVRLWNVGNILARDAATGRAHGDPPKSEALSLDGTVIEVPSTNPSSCSVTTQYPPHLFPNQTFKVHDGWVLGPNEELMLWVPAVNCSDLLTPYSTCRIMGVAHPTELDFSNFKCGMEWMQCREPIDTE